jgi:hypothetical protein
MEKEEFSLFFCAIIFLWSKEKMNLPCEILWPGVVEDV